MEQNTNIAFGNNGGGTITYGASAKFMALVVVLGSVFFYYLLLVQHAWDLPLNNILNILIYIAFFVLWPIASMINFAGAWFSKLIYTNTGIELFTAFGRKHTVAWNSVKKIEFYRRFGFRRFALVDDNGRKYFADSEAEGFLDFLSFTQEHIRPEVEENVRYVIEAARDSIRSISNSI